MKKYTMMLVLCVIGWVLIGVEPNWLPKEFGLAGILLFPATVWYALGAYYEHY